MNEFESLLKIVKEEKINIETENFKKLKPLHKKKEVLLQIIKDKGMRNVQLEKEILSIQRECEELLVKERDKIKNLLSQISNGRKILKKYSAGGKRAPKIIDLKR